MMDSLSTLRADKLVPHSGFKVQSSERKTGLLVLTLNFERGTLNGLG